MTYSSSFGNWSNQLMKIQLSKRLNVLLLDLRYLPPPCLAIQYKKTNMESAERQPCLQCLSGLRVTLKEDVSLISGASDVWDSSTKFQGIFEKNIPSTERCGMLELKSSFCWRSSLARGSLLRITKEKHLEVAKQMIETAPFVPTRSGKVPQNIFGALPF